jgi:hypothetical protein
MRRVTTKIASIAAATAIILAPAAASASALPSSSTSPTAWVTLSQLNPAGATALAGSTAATAAPSSVALAGATAAAQPADDTYRPNPLPLPVVAVLLAVLGTMIYIAFIEKHHQSSRPFLTSPQ